jgi:hypothetical protein
VFPKITFARREGEMLSKCANPGCSAHFLYLHQGKLFRIDNHAVNPESAVAVPRTEEKKPSRHSEYFWLCDDCAAEMTLAYKPGIGVTTVPISRMQAAVGA